MFSRRMIGMLVGLLYCMAVHASPFAPADAAQPPAAMSQPLPEAKPAPATTYRIVGTAIAGDRAVAIVHIADGRLRIIRRGDRIGDVTVIAITLDAVRVETPHGIVHWAVED